jgi:hypothetical protein
VFYDSASDTGELHFKGNVDGDTDTDFYIYYGNASATEPARDATYGLENVWNSNYKGVWHLQEAVNVDTDGYKDSTSNDNHGTGSSMAITAPAGKLAGKGQAFDGVVDYIEAVENGSLNVGGELTLSFWFDVDGLGGDTVFQRAVSKGQSTTTDGGYGVFVSDTSNPIDIGLRFIDSGNTSRDARDTAVTNYNDGAYHAVHATYSDAGDVAKLYVDKVEEASTAITGSLTVRTTVDPLRIGDAVDIRHFNGKIDEVRVLATALAATWISTEHNNQLDTSTFFTIGAQEEDTEVTGFNIAFV